MKSNNQEKSPYSTLSFDPVKISGEKPVKEEFTGKIVSDDDIRSKAGKRK
ncbi:MAG: hypothetical protein IJW03_02720 [Clostridia bacterium]|nr:hypothetical protein [Clostridia bacterium]